MPSLFLMLVSSTWEGLEGTGRESWKLNFYSVSTVLTVPGGTTCKTKTNDIQSGCWSLEVETIM